LTSPQAMNPLPNRPLLNNSSLPVTLPNVPSFDSVPFNGRPRKVMPEVGKDFGMLNGMSTILPGPSSAASSTGQNNPIDRTGILGSALLQSQQQQQQPQNVTGPPLQVQLQPASEILPQSAQLQSESREPSQLSDPDSGPNTIFRPEPAGEWREQSPSHEADSTRAGGSLISDATSWDHRTRDEEEDTKADEEPDVEEEDDAEVEDGEGNKVWKNKRTLRKSVSAQ
jgi:striatin 1/3/4